MSFNWCHNPDCHTLETVSRVRGSGNNKVLRTRKITINSNGYPSGIWEYFCNQRCLYEWINKYIEQGLDHFGRITEAKHLTEENAWFKDYDWRIDDRQNRYFFYNGITKERRPLTEEQYRDTNYTLNTGE